MNTMPQNMLGVATPDSTLVNIPESIVIILLSNNKLSGGGFWPSA
jgi:hypothetical protein